MSSLPTFEIESLLSLAGGKALVMARRLDEEEFHVREGFKLGGLPILGGDIPRALDSDGNQRHDLWGFWLRNPNDLARLKVGQVVELSQ